MKKELLASVLTLTASMASARSFPNYNLAQSTLIEASIVKTIRLKSEYKVRYTTVEGETHTGHIYLDLDSASRTPEYNNQLTGEMSGRLYFESDAYTDAWEGRKFKTTQGLVGDDGDMLLDMTDADGVRGNTYQVYGCNSTRTECSGEAYQLNVIAGKVYSLSANLAANLSMQIGVTHGQNEIEWTTKATHIKMTQVPVEKE
jgi:hypothetical protein